MSIFSVVSSLSLARSYLIETDVSFATCFRVLVFLFQFHDVIQARKEGTGALQCLHDGFVDDYSYQVTDTKLPVVATDRN